MTTAVVDAPHVTKLHILSPEAQRMAHRFVRFLEQHCPEHQTIRFSTNGQSNRVGAYITRRMKVMMEEAVEAGGVLPPNEVQRFFCSPHKAAAIKAMARRKFRGLSFPDAVVFVDSNLNSEDQHQLIRQYVGSKVVDGTEVQMLIPFYVCPNGVTVERKKVRKTRVLPACTI